MARLQVGFVTTATAIVPVLATAADLAAWSPVTGAWQTVTLTARYFPAAHPLLPARAPNNSGEQASFPQPEAAALVAGGFAVLVGTAPTQAGVFSP